MSLLDLYAIPDNPEETAVWAFSHMAHHRDIISQMQTDNLGTFDEFPLDPFDPDDMDYWLARHAEMHRQMDNALSLEQNNLVTTDWNDPSAKEDWYNSHAQEHVEAALILGLE